MWDWPTGTARPGVVVSEAMLTQVRPDARHIPNGVDTNSFGRTTRPRSNGRMRVAFAGTVDPFRFDIDILSMVARTPNVTLVVAGPGQSVDGAENLGALSRTEVPEVLASCDALLAPYRVDCEANRTSDSLKLYEYFAAGKPVVASGVPELGGMEPDVVLAVGPRAFVEAVRDAVDHDGEEDRLRRRQLAARNTWETKTERLLGLVRRELEAGGATG